MAQVGAVCTAQNIHAGFFFDTIKFDDPWVYRKIWAGGEKMKLDRFFKIMDLPSLGPLSMALNYFVQPSRPTDRSSRKLGGF